MRTLRSLCLSLASLAALAATPALAQQYSNDFSTGPGPASLYGTATVTGGFLRLTQAVNGQNGAAVLNTYAAGAKAFEATFTYLFQRPGNPFFTADGMSFNLGVLPDGVIPGATENGPGNGLTVTFDLFDYNNDSIVGDAGIRVYYNGAIVAQAPGAINVLADGGQSRNVRIYLDYSGAITVVYNGATVINNVATGFVPQAGQRFGLAARTGGENAEQRVDNLVVRPYYNQPSCSNAAAIVGDGIWGYSYDAVGSPTEGGASCQPNTCRDVWFCWLAPTTGTVTLSTEGLTDDDSVVTVYNGCYPCPTGFSEVACNDDIDSSNGNFASRLTFAAKAGSTYLIRIAVYSDNGACATASGLEGFSITTHADCPADFDHNGTKNVTDIFAFLTSWFAPCP